MNKTNKQVIMVLGMARCGTSTICRGLNVVGVHLGKKLLRPDQRNPKGFWEDTDVTFKINRGILHEFQHPWIFDDLHELMQKGEHQSLNNFKKYAVNLVHERLADKNQWGFKDTNTTVLLPFWQSVLREADVDDRYVIALRNPLGCAYSNIRHSNLELEAGLLAWLKNMILAVDGSRGKTRVVVAYENMLEQPMQELARMCRELSLDDANQQDMQEYADKFVDKKLHHHVFSDADLDTHPAVAAVPLCHRVYKVLSKLANDNMTFADAEFAAEWQQISAEFYELYPLYRYANVVLKQNLQLQREIRAIHKSWMWKLLRPLWHLDEKLRTFRQMGRMHKRLAKAYG